MEDAGDGVEVHDMMALQGKAMCSLETGTYDLAKHLHGVRSRLADPGRTRRSRCVARTSRAAL